MRRPDYAETLLRGRLMAKQCVLEGIVQDRLAQAARMHQHKHPEEMLVPGTIIDIFRTPDRKDEDGWKGPAELISIERKAGSGIVRYQGQALLIPLHYMRKHILTSFFFWSIYEATDEQLGSPSEDFASEFFINPETVSDVHEVFFNETYLQKRPDENHWVRLVMDIADGTSSSKPTRIGLHKTETGELKFVPDETSVQNCKIFNAMKKAFKQHMANAHGIIYGTALKKLPAVEGATWGIWLRWPRNDRRRYQLKFVRMSRGHTIRGMYHLWSYACLYSYDHEESLEGTGQGLTPDMSDLDDMSDIPWNPQSPIQWDDDDNHRDDQNPRPSKDLSLIHI